MTLPVLTKTNQSGQALLWVVGAAAALGISVYVSMGMFTGVRNTTVVSEQSFHMQLLAADLKEVGKYLLLYERAVYLDNPLKLDSSIKKLWGQAVGQVDSTSTNGIAVSCGGYDILGRYIGNQLLNGQKVFCPSYVRYSSMSGSVLEESFLKPWLSKGVAELVSPGVYRITLDMTEAVRTAAAGSIGSDTLVALNDGTSSEPQPSFALIKEKKVILNSAKVIIEILGNESGFVPILAERYIRITGQINFSREMSLGGLMSQKVVETSEMLMISPSTPKEFSLFLAYPSNASGVKTSNFTEATKLEGVHIFGRTYFNGNIDEKADLNKLPYFHEAVILSGSYLNAPNASNLDQIKKHFNKGVVTQFSSERYLLENATSLQNTTGSGMGITTTAGFTAFENYISNLGNPCWNSAAVVNNGSIPQVSFNFSPLAPPASGISQTCQVGPDSTLMVLRGGYKKLTVNNTGANSLFIVSPVKDLRISNGISIMGTIMGGYIEAADGSKFYSISATYKGLPGIVSDALFSTFNNASSNAYEGVAVPLINMPTVYSASDGGKQ